MLSAPPLAVLPLSGPVRAFCARSSHTASLLAAAACFGFETGIKMPTFRGGEAMIPRWRSRHALQLY